MGLEGYTVIVDSKKHEQFLEDTKDINGIHREKIMQARGVDKPPMAVMRLMNSLGEIKFGTASVKLRKPFYCGEAIEVIPTEKGLEFRAVRNGQETVLLEMEITNTVPKYQEKDTIFTETIPLAKLTYDIGTTPYLIALSQVSGFLYRAMQELPKKYEELKEKNIS